jgi:hypothetical protein
MFDDTIFVSDDEGEEEERPREEEGVNYHDRSILSLYLKSKNMLKYPSLPERYPHPTRG